MNILVAMPSDQTRETFIPEDIAQRIDNMGNVIWNDTGSNYVPGVLREKLKGIDLCICGWECTRFDKYVLEGADRLKILAYTGGSLANIVSNELYDKGVRVLSGNTVFAESVAEGVMAYALCSLRDLPFYIKMVQGCHWPQDDFVNEGLLEQNVGLVGFGAVARYLVNLLKPFRCRIKVSDPYISNEICALYGVEKVSLEEIFSTSKVISIHAPRTPETYHMVNQNLISMIPDGSLLINTARGSIIDEECLADELIKGRFKAILDVFEKEPLPAESRLRGLDNVILVPHMAGPTIDRRKYVTAALLDDIDNIDTAKLLRCEIPRDYAFAMTK